MQKYKKVRTLVAEQTFIRIGHTYRSYVQHRCR